MQSSAERWLPSATASGSPRSSSCGVWNSSTDWNEIAHLKGNDGEPPLLEQGQTLEAFDVMEAWAVWDLEQRYAALTWLQDPFWP